MKSIPIKPFTSDNYETTVTVTEALCPSLGIYNFREPSGEVSQRSAVRWYVWVDGELWFETFSEAMALMLARSLISNAEEEI